MGAVALVHVQIDDEHSAQEPAGAQGSRRADDVVEHAEALAGVVEGVVGAAAQVRSPAVLERGLGRQKGGADRAAGALDELGRPGKPERQQLTAAQLAALDLSDVGGVVAAGELVRRRRTRGLDLEPVDVLGAFPNEAVLLQREAVPRGQRVREDIVGEGAHGPKL